MLVIGSPLMWEGDLEVKMMWWLRGENSPLNRPNWSFCPRSHRSDVAQNPKIQRFLIDQVLCPINRTCVRLLGKVEFWVCLTTNSSLMSFLILGDYCGPFWIPSLRLDCCLNLCKYHLDTQYLTNIRLSTLYDPQWASSLCCFSSATLFVEH